MDFLKFLAIFCVCMGHCIQHFLSGWPADRFAFRLIYSFHMPLFMAITGFFVYTDSHVNFWSMIRKKARQLILPAVSFTIAIPLVVGSFSKYTLWHCLDSYWFLRCAFICVVIYYGARCIFPKRWIWVGILLTLAASQAIIPFNVFRMYPAFITGVLIRKYFAEIKSSSYGIGMLCMLLFATMLVFLSADYYGNQDMSSVKGLIITFYHLWYRILIGSIATLGFVCLAYSFRDLIAKYTFFQGMSYVGRYTLGIYILQTFILETTLGSVLNFDKENIYVFYFIIAPIISLLVICVSVLIINILKMGGGNGLLFFRQRLSSNFQVVSLVG